MPKAKKDHAYVTWDRKGKQWAVRIDLTDGRSVLASPGNGGQKVVYDRPQSVPRDLKFNVVPRLVEEAKIKNLRGDRPE